MIKSKIKIKFVHQYNSIVNFGENIFIADYTEQTKTFPIKRGVELFSPNPPTDINYFSVINLPKLSIDGIGFDNTSFVHNNGNPKTQCEAVFFPKLSVMDSWILFCELKYSSKPLNNKSNLRKAIRQLFKTRYYYIHENIMGANNTCYLIASLPQQSEPFANFSVTPACLAKLKQTRNIVLRMGNSVKVINNKFINV